MPKAVLTISSRNYGAWALRGWLMAKLAKLDFTEHVVPPDDPAMKAEILLLSPSILVLLPDSTTASPSGTRWPSANTWHESGKPRAGLLPAEIARRVRTAAPSAARCTRASPALRSSALPMNIKAHFPKLQGVVARARATSSASARSGTSGLATYGGPYLFGAQPCMADAMYAPVVTRFLTYDVQLDAVCVGLLQDHHGHARHEGVGEAAAARPSPTRSTSSTRIFDPPLRNGVADPPQGGELLRICGAGKHGVKFCSVLN
jgi:glutathione S-transferase